MLIAALAGLWLGGFAPPAAAEERFLRGDANDDGSINIADVVHLLVWLVRGDAAPRCLDAADVDDTGRHNITDGIYLLGWLFQGGPAPPAPGPSECGPDPTGDPFGCAGSRACPAAPTGPVTLERASPREGESGVALTRETVFEFSGALDPATVTPAAVSAAAAGSPLASRLHLSRDGRALTLFYTSELPPNTRVRVTLDGELLTDTGGRGVDLDRDGLPGGQASFGFTTLGVTPIAGTSVCGRVFASELAKTPGGAAVNTPLAGVTVSVDGSGGALAAVTDQNGAFRLEPAPAGRFFVHVDGRTATAGVPMGAYYPLVGKAWEATAGRETVIGDIFLPLVPPGTLQEASATTETTITFPPAVLAEHPEFAGTQLTVPAGAAFFEDGTPGRLVGIAAVPPDRLPEPLPPGLDFPIVITVQSGGATNFDVPVPVCFPNLPHPRSGEVLAPGATSALWSFNHDTGRFEMQGSMTVSADGRLVCTDPGVGIRAPGWAGSFPGSGGGGGGGPRKFRRGDSDDGDNGEDDDDEDDLEPKRNPRCPATLVEASIGEANCGLQAMADKNNCIWSRSPFLDNCDGLLDELFCYWIGVLGDDSTSCEEAMELNAKFCFEFYADCKIQIITEGGGAGGGGAPQTGDPLLDEMAEILYDLFDDYRMHLQLEAPIRAIVGDAQSNEDLTPEQIAAMTPLQDQLIAFLGGLRPHQFYGPREERVEVLLEQFAAQTDFFSDSRSYYLLEEQGTGDGGGAGGAGFVRRGKTDAGGAISNLILAPSTVYKLYRLAPDSLKYSEVLVLSAPAGVPTRIPRAPRTFGPDPDEDGDGISSRAEVVVGTRPDVADTDGDGVLDGAEVRQGTDPLDGIAVAAGLAATADTPGFALDVSALDDRVVVADGADGGVSVFNVFSGMSPTLVARVDTPGSAEAVASGGDLIAVADGGLGLAVIDLRDPSAAAILYRIPTGAAARAVAVSGGVVYVGLSTGQVQAYDLAAGAFLAEVIELGSVDDLVVSGGLLYIITAESFVVRKPVAGGMAKLGELPQTPSVFFRRRRLAVGGGFAYVSERPIGPGYTVIDVRDPGTPGVVGEGGGGEQIYDVAVTGTGLLVAAGGVIEQQGLSLYDSTLNRFLTLLATSGTPRAVEISSGLAYVADGLAGLEVVNFLAADTAGVPPAITLATSAGGGRAEEGQTLLLSASVGDDVQVRSVEFYLDGERLVTDGNFPFEHVLVAPLLSEASSLTFRARASDTGGNSAWSQELTLQLAADATPPTVVSTLPRDGVTIGAGAVTVVVTFSEPIDEGRLSEDAFAVFAPGPDAMLGTGDDVRLMSGEPEYSAGAQTAFLTLPALAPGSYRALLSGISDLAGNALAAPVSFSFTARDAVRWITDGDGFWDEGAHWSTGAPPGLGDVVEIDRPGAGITVTHRHGETRVARIDCAESLVVSGGILTLDDASLVEGGFELSGSAELAGVGDLTAAGPFVWSGGTMRGPGATIARGGLERPALAEGASLTAGRRLENHAAAVVAARFFMLEGASFLNAEGATLDLEPNVIVNWDHNGLKPLLINEGTITINGDAVEIEVYLTNNGTVVVGGDLQLAAGSQTSAGGRFEFASGVELEFGGGRADFGGQHVFSAGSELAGVGDVRFSIGTPAVFVGGYRTTGKTVVQGGEVDFQGAASTGSFELFGGQLRLTAPLAVTGSALLRGGTIFGPGSLVSTGQLRTLTTTTRLDGGAIVENRGTATFEGGGIRNTGGGGRFLNALGATAALRTGADLGATAVVNDGLITSSSTNGSLGSLTNNGTVRADAGRLAVAVGTSGGAFEVAGGAILQFNAGGAVPVLEPVSSVAGGGAVVFNTPVTVSGTYDVGGGTTVSSGVSVFTSGVVFDGVVSSLGPLLLQGLCVLEVDGQASTLTLQVEGRLRGAGVLTVAGLTTWGVGTTTMEGSGRTVALGGIAMSGAGTKQLLSRTLENHGLWSWGAELRWGQGATIINAANGTIEFQGDAGATDLGGAQPRLFNAGTLKKTAGSQLLLLGGDFTQEPGGTLRLRLRGLAAGSQFDQIDFDAAALGGTLAIDLEAGFTPTLGDEFEVLTGLTSHSGAFASLADGALPAGLEFDVDYDRGPSRVVLKVVSSGP